MTTQHQPNRPVILRTKVLIELCPDGIVRVYSNRFADVHIFNRLDVGTETPELATLIDEYHAATMPKCYQDMYWPNKCRAVGFHEKVTPEKAAETLYQRAILQALKKEGGE